MIKKVYVVDHKDIEVHAVCDGLDLLEMEYTLVNEDSTKKLSLGPDACFIGNVIDMKRVLRAASIKRNLTSYPVPLRPFMKRDINETTVEDVVERVLGGERLFVKPYEDKEFHPSVLDKDNVQLYLMHLSEDKKVFTSNPVKFESEFRVFVCEGEMIGIRETNGSKSNVDWHLVDFEFIHRAKSVVLDSPSLPKTLIMDFGLMKTDKGITTALVECNPGYAFGSYGLDKEKVIKVLFACWEEMVKENFEFSFATQDHM